jgi:PITH domain
MIETKTSSIMDLFPSATAGGNDNNDRTIAASASGQMVDLRDKIEKASCYARNEAFAFPMTNLFIGDSSLGCKSDADEQLILHIAFQEFVKVCLMQQLESHIMRFFTSRPNKLTDCM